MIITNQWKVHRCIQTLVCVIWHLNLTCKTMLSHMAVKSIPTESLACGHGKSPKSDFMFFRSTLDSEMTARPHSMCFKEEKEFICLLMSSCGGQALAESLEFLQFPDCHFCPCLTFCLHVSSHLVHPPSSSAFQLFFHFGFNSITILVICLPYFASHSPTN